LPSKHQKRLLMASEDFEFHGCERVRATGVFREGVPRR
jgi:hypothetical protein